MATKRTLVQKLRLVAETSGVTQGFSKSTTAVAGWAKGIVAAGLAAVGFTKFIGFMNEELAISIESFIEHFREEFEYHLTEKKCMSGSEPGVFTSIEAVAVT